MAEARKRVLDIINLTKTYGLAPHEVTALRGISLVVESGEFVSIMGQSGSGKSTLLHVLGCLHRSTSGTYLLDGVDVSDMDDTGLSALRNQNIVENVALPLVYAHISRPQRLVTAENVLRLVGLGDRLRHKPSELSGGRASAWRSRGRW